MDQYDWAEQSRNQTESYFDPYRLLVLAEADNINIIYTIQGYEKADKCSDV